MSAFWYQLSKPRKVLCSFSLLILLQLFLSLPAIAQIYQCWIDGVATFSDEPCDGVPSRQVRKGPSPESAASADKPRVDADLRRRQLRLILIELNNGKPATARSLAQDYGIDFDRVYAQWQSASAQQKAQQEKAAAKEAIRNAELMAQEAMRRAAEAEDRAARAEMGLPPSPAYAPPPGSNHAQCMGNCASDQGICISRCRGDGQCIGHCATAHGMCVSRCPL